LMPRTSVWSGYKNNQCKYYTDNDPVLFYASTAGGTPFRGCLHVADEGHTLIIGSNTSLVMNFLAAQQCRYKNAKIFVFDSNHASFAMTSSIPESVHYDIGYGDDSISFQPLAYLDNQEDFTFAVDWLAGLCKINKFDIKPHHLTIIGEVLEIIRKEANHRQRTLSYFYYHITSKDADLAAQFKPYISTSGNSLQNMIFEATENYLTLGAFTVFEIEKLARKGDGTLIPTILYLFYMIERSLDGSPVSIYLHDGWTIFKHPVFSGFLDDWLRKIATKNVQIIIGVHQPADILKSEIAGILMQSCKTKIFTANLNANSTQKSSYLELGLNEVQVELIGSAIANREYYFTSPLGNRLIQFHLGDLSKIFLQPPSLEQIEQIRELQTKDKNLFGYNWIKQNALLDEIADFWLNSHKKFTQTDNLQKGSTNE
jgi:type IV secretion system protein TrbE